MCFQLYGRALYIHQYHNPRKSRDLAPKDMHKVLLILFRSRQKTHPSPRPCNVSMFWFMITFTLCFTMGEVLGELA